MKQTKNQGNNRLQFNILAVPYFVRCISSTCGLPENKLYVATRVTATKISHTETIAKIYIDEERQWYDYVNFEFHALLFPN